MGYWRFLFQESLFIRPKSVDYSGAAVQMAEMTSWKGAAGFSRPLPRPFSSYLPLVVRQKQHAK